MPARYEVGVTTPHRLLYTTVTSPWILTAFPASWLPSCCPTTPLSDPSDVGSPGALASRVRPSAAHCVPGPPPVCPGAPPQTAERPHLTPSGRAGRLLLVTSDPSPPPPPSHTFPPAAAGVAVSGPPRPPAFSSVVVFIGHCLFSEGCPLHQDLCPSVLPECRARCLACGVGAQCNPRRASVSEWCCFSRLKPVHRWCYTHLSTTNCGFAPRCVRVFPAGA